jgi:hypothetical protein
MLCSVHCHIANVRAYVAVQTVDGTLGMLPNPATYYFDMSERPEPGFEGYREVCMIVCIACTGDWTYMSEDKECMAAHNTLRTRPILIQC